MPELIRHKFDASGCLALVSIQLVHRQDSSGVPLLWAKQPVAPALSALHDGARGAESLLRRLLPAGGGRVRRLPLCGRWHTARPAAAASAGRGRLRGCSDRRVHRPPKQGRRMPGWIHAHRVLAQHRLNTGSTQLADGHQGCRQTLSRVRRRGLVCPMPPVALRLVGAVPKHGSQPGREVRAR